MVADKKLFFNLEVTVLRLLYLLSNDKSVAKVMWVIDDIILCLEAELPVEPSDGEKCNTCVGSGIVYHFLLSTLLLCIELPN